MDTPVADHKPVGDGCNSVEAIPAAGTDDSTAECCMDWRSDEGCGE